MSDTEIRPVLITPENHAKFNAVTDRYKWDWEDALSAMCSLNDHLDDRLGTYNDNGGAYNSWLGYFGIEANTNEGWWSLDAINQDNIDAYVEWESGEDDNEWCEQVRCVFPTLKQLRKDTSISINSHQVKNVREVVAQLIELPIFQTQETSK